MSSAGSNSRQSPAARFAALLLFAIAAAIALDALLLECGRTGFSSHSPRRLALDVTLAALSTMLGLAASRGWRAILKPSGAFLLGLALFCANTRPLWSGDTQGAFLLPFAIVRTHSFALDGVTCSGPSAAPMYAATRGADGRLWSRYPIMTGLLALPFELPAAVTHFDQCAPIARDLEKVTAALLAALMLALLSLALRALFDEALSAVTLLLWTLGTAVLPVLGQALWQHTGTALGASLAILALTLRARAISLADLAARTSNVGARTSPSKPRTLQLEPALANTELLRFLLGAGAGLVIACRPPDFPIALALLWAWARLDRAQGFAFPARFRSLAPALVVAAIPVAIHLACQWRAFGGPFHTGYGEEATNGWTFSAAPIQLLGLLVSPGRGLLIWSPILLVALLPLFRPPDSPLAPALRILALGLGAQLLLIACWWAWHGGSTFGPRMHAGGLPLFAPLLALGLESIGKSTTRRRVVVALAIASVVPTAMITFVPPPREAAEASIHLRVSGGAWNLLAWPPWGYWH